MNRTTAFIPLLLSSTVATPALAAHASRPASVSRADKSSPTNHPGVSSPGRLRFRRVLARIAERSCHLYARYRPLDPSGNYDPKKGMREFIVGTGGETLEAAVTTNTTAADPSGNPNFSALNLEASTGQFWGVMSLTLNQNGYAWDFESALKDPAQPTGPSSFSDKGVGTCQGQLWLTLVSDVPCHLARLFHHIGKVQRLQRPLPRRPAPESTCLRAAPSPLPSIPQCP